MRIPILLASVAALALASCDSGPFSSQQESETGSSIDESHTGEFREVLKGSIRHGLTPDLFFKGDIDSASAADLSDALLQYASALAMGKVDPAKLGKVYTVPRPKVDVRAGFNQALAQNKLGEWLESLAPQTTEYRTLSRAFVHYAEVASKTPDSNLPQGEPMKLGSDDPRVPALVEALKAVNISARDRARQLAVALERLRWLERNPPATRIDVNTAATFLTYFRDGQQRDRRRVVVGEPGWETPQLGSPIFQLVANPTWTVPESIVEAEISHKSGAWLRQNNFVRRNGRWVQQPGPKNALGEVKFDMRNDEAIYLHDTPAKALFEQDERHKSHGCIRVQGALDFARMLASENDVLDKFGRAMASGDETFVDLPGEIPVRLMYHTAFVGPDCRVGFVPDVYGWDNDVAAALGYETRQPPQLEHRPGDVGP